MNEDVFQVSVKRWLEEHFIHVDEEPVLHDTERRPDFLVRTPFETYVIEAENDFENLYTGIGQVIGYAAETDGIPIVVLPAGEIEQPEMKYIESYFDSRFDYRHLRVITVSPHDA